MSSPAVVPSAGVSPSGALGAAMIEKHFTLRRAEGGPDAAFSLEPEEFAAMTAACRNAHKALGRVDYGLAASEAGSRTVRRSLYAVADIAAGEAISHANVRSIRPGYGLPPKHLPALIGRKARRAIARGTPLSWGDVEG